MQPIEHSSTGNYGSVFSDNSKLEKKKIREEDEKTNGHGNWMRKCSAEKRVLNLKY